jgi:transcriptional regulator with XRE-family HTH domain
MELQDVVQWCDTRGMQDWILLLDHLVVLLRNAIMVQDNPIAITTIQDVIGQTLSMRGWHVASLAQATGVEMSRLIQLLNYEGAPPSREELAALSNAVVKHDGSGWTTEELDVLTRIQYGEAYYTQYTSLPMLVCRNWDLLCNSPIGIERLQLLRDGAAPTEMEVLRLALLLRLDEEFVYQLSQGAIAW